MAARCAHPAMLATVDFTAAGEFESEGAGAGSGLASAGRSWRNQGNGRPDHEVGARGTSSAVTTPSAGASISMVVL